MDETSTLGDDALSLFTSGTLPHDILPQLPGYRANGQIQNRKKAALKCVGNWRANFGMRPEST